MTSRASKSSGSRACLRVGLTKLVAVIALCAVALAACSTPIKPPPTASSGPCVSGAVFNPADFHPCWLAANVNAVGPPILGGTLQIEGDQDVFAMLDPQGEYGPVGPMIERAYTRQLVTYPASTNLVTAETPVPDAATGMPTVSADGLTYTFRIKSGVKWNTTPPRQVTSQDFKRGIERNCDPTLAPLGNPTYYTATIASFASFCTAFSAMKPASPPAARAAYINDNDKDVLGIQTPNSSTIVFKLIQPASDFLNILAQPFASAAPVEDLNYVPVTPGNPVYSDGPYQVAKYDVGHEIDLEHNPAWSQSTDTIRHDYVTFIDIKLDLPGTGAAEDVQDDIATGAADLATSTRVPADDVAALTRPVWNSQYGVFPQAGSSTPFVRFNVLSPNNNGALADKQVRQALEYAINKVAINNIFGGASLAEPLNQVIGPGAEGYAPIDDYHTQDNMGDPGECKKLLTAAGYPDGLTLKDIYIDYLPLVVEVFPEVQADFARCGVTVTPELVSNQSDFYGPSFGLSASADVLKQPTTWDITTSTGWGPDWFGPANGRAILPDLFDSAYGIPGVGDFGGYDDKTVNALVDQAERATSLAAAAKIWHEADEQVMADAAFIPLQTELTPLFRSVRVHNAIFIPFSNSYDITQVWLSQSG
jgi:ABC-type transport system substrate-binding protein